VLQWNQHRTDDPAHAWLRALLQEIARDDVSACR
jgi:hypothetical protein